MNVILFLIIFINLLLGIFVFTQNPKSIHNRLFLLVGLLAAIWTFANYMTGVSSSIMWLRSTYALGSLVMSVGLIWTITMTEDIFDTQKTLIISLFSLFFFFGSYKNGFIVNYYGEVKLGAIFTGSPGWGLTLYTIYYMVISFLILYKLYICHKNTTDINKRYQMKYIFIGSLSTLLISAFSSFILPHFSIFLFAGIDSIGFLIFLIAIAYSITKHHLFNIKMVAIELVTFSLWIIMIVRIMVAQNPQEILIESLLLTITVIFGILLIRTSLRELQQRDELEILNNHLEQKVAEQTADVKRAYDLEKKARRDLEKLNETKDQFIMITQHNLRTPVTSIKWEIESLLSGSHGEISKEIRETLMDTSTSIASLTRIVDDFLNITALKAGSQILNLSVSSMKPLLESVLQELRMDIAERHLAIDYPTDPDMWPEINMDSGKIKEVLLIIIENAVKYNIKNGSIHIKTSLENEIFQVTVKNTGVGITSEEKLNIFERLFYRGKKAQSTHPGGMGIGLTVSRAIVRAHHGDITIHSDGENMGAGVTLILPVDFIKTLVIDGDNKYNNSVV